MNQGNTSAFKDPTRLTKWTKGLLYAQIVILVIALISGALQYQLLSDCQKGVYTSESEIMAAAEANDARQGLVAVIQFGVFLITAIFVLKWIYRANYNGHQLGAPDMKFTPGWSIGWYFVPIANLWKPYQAMKEIWMVSEDAENWRTQSIPPLLPWWWFFWIVSSLLGQASFRLSMRAEELNELIAVSVVMLVSDAVGIPLNLIVLAMFGKVLEMQMRQHRNEDM